MLPLAELGSQLSDGSQLLVEVEVRFEGVTAHMQVMLTSHGRQLGCAGSWCAAAEACWSWFAPALMFCSVCTHGVLALHAALSQLGGTEQPFCTKKQAARG